jgi:geranylgeranyl diphosphate synthase type I
MIFKDKLNLIFKTITKTIDPVIEELLDFYVDKKFRKIVKYQILTGGKRIRPALIITCCKLLDGRIKDATYPAAGLEILHNYSLIIDDIIDNSNLRRRKPTLWAKFGRTIAQCISVDYTAAAFQAANRSKEPVKISELFAKTMKIVVGGEILDILFERTGREGEPYIVKNRYQKIGEKDYFEMISKKTATLFQTCCQVGGICAKAKERQIEALSNYGFNLGIAFQIKDDILDIFGKERAFGKKIGKDVKERKGGNIVILFALKKLNLANKKKLQKILRKRRINKNDIEEVINLIKKTDAYQKAYQLGKNFIGEAKKNLLLLPQNKWNNILREIADFVMEREH